VVFVLVRFSAGVPVEGIGRRFLVVGAGIGLEVRHAGGHPFRALQALRRVAGPKGGPLQVHGGQGVGLEVQHAGGRRVRRKPFCL
jgi:hypothetical protein